MNEILKLISDNISFSFGKNDGKLNKGNVRDFVLEKGTNIIRKPSNEIGKVIGIKIIGDSKSGKITTSVSYQLNDTDLISEEDIETFCEVFTF